MGSIEVIKDLAERVAQPDALVGPERSDRIHHVIDRVVLAQAFLALGGDVQDDRTLVLMRRLSHQKGLALQSLHDLRCSRSGGADEAGQRGRGARNPLARPRKRSAIHSRSRNPC